MFDQNHYSLSADFTIPLSWIKSKDCKIEGEGKRCHRMFETFVEKVKEGDHKSKLHKKMEGHNQNAIIEGSSETIRGSIEKDKNVTFTVKDSNRLNNLL